MNAASDSPKGSPFAVASIILSTGLVAIGNGLMFAFIPVRLAADGFDPAWAGSILTALSAGGMAGCLFTNPVIRRVGHARAYMAFSGLIILSNALLAMTADPAYWLAARMLYGFAINALFIISQSWLNDAVANAVRGRVMGAFYVTYIVGLGTGALVMGAIDITANAAPVIGIAFAALSLLPVGLTRLAVPAAPASGTISLERAWRISPVALVGMAAVGGMSMLVGGFTPIHLSAAGYGKQDLAWLMFLMPLGTIIIQGPSSWISDRMDRRYVLIAISLLSAASGLFALGAEGAAILVLIPIYMLWDGATETIYSIANAQAGDRAQRHDQVMMSSTLLFVWSSSAFLAPGLATLLTTRFGTMAFMPLAIGLALIYAVFALWRLMQSKPADHPPATDFAPHPMGAPSLADLPEPEKPAGIARTLAGKKSLS